MITFGAKYISDVKIKKLGRDGNYRDLEVSFIKFDSRSKADHNALNTLARWDNYNSYSKPINNNFQSLCCIKNIFKNKFFAITTQKDNFKEIDADKVLGLLQASERGKINFIDYFLD